MKANIYILCYGVQSWICKCGVIFLYLKGTVHQFLSFDIHTLIRPIFDLAHFSGFLRLKNPPKN